MAHRRSEERVHAHPAFASDPNVTGERVEDMKPVFHGVGAQTDVGDR
jgi:hypothetical protein